MATIPARQDSFFQVMICLKYQSELPDTIWITFDGHEDGSLAKMAAQITGRLVISRSVREPGHGVWERWEALANIPDTDLVTVVDDDWFLDPRYLENCRLQWVNFASTGKHATSGRFSSVIGWMGWITPWHMMGATMNPACPTPMAYLTGGLLTGLAGDFKAAWGSVPAEMRARLFGDDLALAVGMSRLRIPRIRPWKCSHALELPAQRGPEAIVSQHLDAMKAGVLELFEKYDVSAVY